MRIYNVQHFYDEEKPKFIGAFSSMEKAYGAIGSLVEKPGFSKSHKILTEPSQKGRGFVITSFRIDELVFKTVKPKTLLKKQSEIFILEHHFSDDKGNLNYKMIAVTSSEKNSKQIAMKLKNRPEFKNSGEILQPHTIGNGFLITPVILDECDWTEGFQLPY